MHYSFQAIFCSLACYLFALGPSVRISTFGHDFMFISPNWISKMKKSQLVAAKHAALHELKQSLTDWNERPTQIYWPRYLTSLFINSTYSVRVHYKENSSVFHSKKMPKIPNDLQFYCNYNLYHLRIKFQMRDRLLYRETYLYFFIDSRPHLMKVRDKNVIQFHLFNESRTIISMSISLYGRADRQLWCRTSLAPRLNPSHSYVWIRFKGLFLTDWPACLPACPHSIIRNRLLAFISRLVKTKGTSQRIYNVILWR